MGSVVVHSTWGYQGYQIESPPSDMADLHNLVVSFTASHGSGDEWHPQKIIFLLGCNKSYVKCSTAYIEKAARW